MDKDIALYIHIPFCKQKCLYCDFPSFSGKETLMMDYIRALCKEIDERVNRGIKTIFIGGGTPTYLPLEGFKLLKNSIDKLGKSDDIEFTVEGNPGTFDLEKIKVLKELGANRLSIGLQAWQNHLLKRLGRIHTVEQFVESYNTARRLGFDNINIDLMFGLPGQTIKDWQETLNNVTELQPEHISCYSLIIEEGTPFCSMYEKTTLKLPDEDSEREMYELSVKSLKDKGYNQYEISNFSKQYRECRHNLVYWDLQEYIGCGSGAHSYLNGLRIGNTTEIDQYIKMINLGNMPKVEEHKNSLEDDMEEFMFMGLRKIKGVSIDEFAKRFHVKIEDIYGDIIDKYVNRGLLIKESERIFLSFKGIELSNTVMSDFIL